MTDDISTIEYAIRYCMGRNSYAFNDGLSLAEQHWDDIGDATKRDVLHAVRHNEPVDLKPWPTILAARFPNLDGYPSVSSDEP